MDELAFLSTVFCKITFFLFSCLRTHYFLLDIYAIPSFTKLNCFLLETFSNFEEKNELKMKNSRMFKIRFFFFIRLLYWSAVMILKLFIVKRTEKKNMQHKYRKEIIIKFRHFGKLRIILIFILIIYLKAA